MMRWLVTILYLCLAMVIPALAGVAATPPLSRGWENHARQALWRGECFTAESLVEQAIAAGDPMGYSVRGEMYETGRCAERS
jgi:hypothetical protein